MIRSIDTLQQRKQLPVPKPELRAVLRRAEPLLLEREELLLLYHAVATQLQPDRPRIIEIMSSTHGEGTSTIARELARAVASDVGHSVLLVVATSGAPRVPGLEAVAKGELPFDAAIEADADVPLFYRTTLCVSGSNTSLLFERSELDQVLAQALRYAKLVIIDAPPALSQVAAFP